MQVEQDFSIDMLDIWEAENQSFFYTVFGEGGACEYANELVAAHYSNRAKDLQLTPTKDNQDAYILKEMSYYPSRSSVRLSDITKQYVAVRTKHGLKPDMLLNTREQQRYTVQYGHLDKLPDEVLMKELHAYLEQSMMLIKTLPKSACDLEAMAENQLETIRFYRRIMQRASWPFYVVKGYPKSEE